MKWFYLILTNPLEAFDLTDDRGRPDHGKIAGWVAFWVFVALTLVDKLPPLGQTITMFAGVFGSRMFLAFLKSRTATSTETVTITQTEPDLWRDDERGGHA